MWVFYCLRVSRCSQATGSNLPLRSFSDKLLPWHQFHELMVPLRLFFPYVLSSWLKQMFLVPMATNLPPFLMGIFLGKGTAQPLPYQSRIGWHGREMAQAWQLSSDSTWNVEGGRLSMPLSPQQTNVHLSNKGLKAHDVSSAD